MYVTKVRPKLPKVVDNEIFLTWGGGTKLSQSAADTCLTTELCSIGVEGRVSFSLIRKSVVTKVIFKVYIYIYLFIDLFILLACIDCYFP